MPEATLQRCRVLVAEDEYMLADELREFLEECGAEVIGPVPTVAAAMNLVRAGTRIDAAVLDVNLQGELVFPVADALLARGVRLVFATGYQDGAIPAQYAEVAHCEKPVAMRSLSRMLRFETGC